MVPWLSIAHATIKFQSPRFCLKQGAAPLFHGINRSMLYDAVKSRRSDVAFMLSDNA